MTASARDAWQAGLSQEIAFWDAWLASRGSCYGCDPEEFRARFDPTTPLQENLRALVADHDDRRVYILDVGAGPATALGSQWPGHFVHILPIDPLANEYQTLLTKYGLAAPVPTMHAHGETLAAPYRFGYDIAYARNSVDHAYDPREIIARMFDLVRPGGCVYLLHHDYEAGRRRGEGLHQWDFFPDGDGNYAMVQYTADTPRADHRLRYPNMTMRAIGNQTEVIIRKPHA